MQFVHIQCIVDISHFLFFSPLILFLTIIIEQRIIASQSCLVISTIYYSTKTLKKIYVEFNLVEMELLKKVFAFFPGQSIRREVKSTEDTGQKWGHGLMMTMTYNWQMHNVKRSCFMFICIRECHTVIHSHKSYTSSINFHQASYLHLKRTYVFFFVWFLGKRTMMIVMMFKMEIVNLTISSEEQHTERRGNITVNK